jgi:predicted ATPase/DNA-binding SARP family transcriptional activator
MIRFRILGGLDLRNGEGIEVRSVLAQPQRVGLLACLALAGESGFVRRDTLLGRLWPDSPQDRARHSLNQALYGLRRSLGRDTVVSRGDEEVCLEPASLWCDVRAFETALLGGRDEEALELHRGELLPGFFLPDAPDFEGWLEEYRGRVRMAAVSAAWRLSEAAEGHGQTAAAVSWARRAVALSGDEETGARRLLRLLQRSGDRAGAVNTYEALVRRLRADPGVEPSPETRSLFEEIRGPRPDPERPAALPPRPGAPLVGREEEMARLEGLLADPHARLVTLTGPGGVGKTRLAVELLHRSAEAGPPAAWFVPLAGVAGPELIPAAVAQTLGVSLGDRVPDAAVIRHLARRGGLLILDNLDHLMEAAPFVSRLLDQAPDLRVVVTSREPLRLRGEWVLPLEGLELPAEDADGPEVGPGVEVGPAVRLFAEAARRMTGGFALDDENRPWVVRICRMVDGIPLAIELAASWSRSMPAEEIAREIEASRSFLTRSFRDGPERHRSLEATFDRSWVLLGESLRSVLSRLSVFRGGLDRDAAEAVAGGGLEELAALVDKSLLRCLAGGRWELLEVVREFAGEKLAEDPEAEREALEHHALHFARLLEALGPGLTGPEKDDALARAAVEMDNLRTAWRTAYRQRLLGALDGAAGPLFTVYDGRGWHREAEAAFREAAEALAPGVEGGSTDEGQASTVMGRILARRGAALLRLGRGGEGESLLRRALELSKGAGDRREAAFVLDRMSLVAYEEGDFPRAVELQGEALGLRRELDDPREVATSLNNLGSLHYATGQHLRAQALCRECLAHQRLLGDRTGEVISLQNLGHIAMALGNPEEAERWLLESLAAARHLRHGVLTARSLLGLATVANARGAPDEARRYLQPALARAMQIGAESLTVEGILGSAWAHHHQGDDRGALELVGAVLSHPDVEPGARAAGERLLQRLEGSFQLGEVEAVLEAGRALGIRGAASQLAGPLPVG